MAVMRVRPDGSALTTLVSAGNGDEDRRDAARHCVGIAIDAAREQLYWTQKGAPSGGKGRIFRAGIEIPVGETAASRTDISEVLSGLPEPIDLQFDPRSRKMFWTDRGAPPGGQSVNAAVVCPDGLEARRVLYDGLGGGIGIHLDQQRNQLYVTDLDGHLYVSDSEGNGKRALVNLGTPLTGLTFMKG
jgi:hypothetical protein